MSELKPCPFCGGKNLNAAVCGDDGELSLYCNDCLGGVFITRDDVPDLEDDDMGEFNPLETKGCEPLIKKWNTRPAEQPKIDRTKIKKIIFEALGSASLCWEPKPKGIFDSEQAIKFGEQALDAIIREMEQGKQ